MRRFLASFTLAVCVSACNTVPTESPGENALTKKIDIYLTETVDRLKKQFPTSGWAYSHLASAYARTGANALARQSYEKAIELLPEEESFREELKKL